MEGKRVGRGWRDNDPQYQDDELLYGLKVVRRG